MARLENHSSSKSNLLQNVLHRHIFFCLSPVETIQFVLLKHLKYSSYYGNMEHAAKI